jgi:hypothetical protein
MRPSSAAFITSIAESSFQYTQRFKDRKMTKDKMVDWFKSAPKGSRHQCMVWAARKIAPLTGVTEGGAYQMLLGALIETERQLPDEYLDALGLTR